MRFAYFVFTAAVTGFCVYAALSDHSPWSAGMAVFNGFLAAWALALVIRED